MTARNADRAYRYWHHRFEWCPKCKRHRAIGRDEKCPDGHPRKAWMRNTRLVSGCLRKGAHPIPQLVANHAQIANLLKSWHNESGSWSGVARAIMDPFDNREWTYRALKELDRLTSLLNAEANGKIESDEVARLLGLRFPKPYRRAAYFGRGETARRLAERWDAVAKQWGGMTGLARGILDGTYEVVEV